MAKIIPALNNNLKFYLSATATTLHYWQHHLLRMCRDRKIICAEISDGHRTNTCV